MNRLHLICKNLARHPAKNVLTAAAVGLAVAASVAMAAIAWGFEASWKRTDAAHGTDILVARRDWNGPLPDPFDADRAAAIRVSDAVASSAGVLSDMIDIEAAEHLIVLGWEPETFLWDHLVVTAGSIDKAYGAHNGVYLGVVTAEVLGKKVGDTLHLDSRPFEVKAIFDSGTLIENGAIIAPLPVAQSIFDLPNKINFLDVRLGRKNDPDQVLAIRQLIDMQCPELVAYPTGEAVSQNIGIMAAKALCALTTVIASTIGLLALVNALLASVTERTAEIGVLTALGWKRKHIVGMILGESMALSAAGALLGIPVGIGAALALQITPLLKGKIEPLFDPLFLLATMIVALAAGGTAGIAPAIRAARLRPVQTLRSL
jgi:putative ABC transport system permease protein